VALSDEVALLMGWLRHDVLAVAGPCSADRRALSDFVVAEFKVLCFRRNGKNGPLE
jgi:hypothetical protein